MSIKSKLIIALQVLISFLLFMATIFVFFTENNSLMSVQLLFTSFLFGISSIIIFIKKYEAIMDLNKLKILWIIGWLFSLFGFVLNIGVWTFGVVVFAIAIVMSYNIKDN